MTLSYLYTQTFKKKCKTMSTEKKDDELKGKCNQSWKMSDSFSSFLSSTASVALYIDTQTETKPAGKRHIKQDKARCLTAKWTVSDNDFVIFFFCYKTTQKCQRILNRHFVLEMYPESITESKVRRSLLMTLYPSPYYPFLFKK